MTNVESEAPARRGRGRPRQPNPVRNAQRAPQRPASLRRTPTGRLPVGDDMFWYDESARPEGFTYQWNAVAVIGNEDIVSRQMASMMRNGWTPVPASRHPELHGFKKPGPEDHIIIGGQMLMERPVEMTEEAREEDYQRAVGQVRQNNERLQISGDKELPRRTRDGQSMASIRRDRNDAIPVPEGGDYEYE